MLFFVKLFYSYICICGDFYRVLLSKTLLSYKKYVMKKIILSFTLAVALFYGGYRTHEYLTLKSDKDIYDISFLFSGAISHEASKINLNGNLDNQKDKLGSLLKNIKLIEQIKLAGLVFPKPKGPNPICDWNQHGGVTCHPSELEGLKFVMPSSEYKIQFKEVGSDKVILDSKKVEGRVSNVFQLVLKEKSEKQVFLTLSIEKNGSLFQLVGP